MSPANLAQAVLLGLGVASELLSCLGTLVMRDVFDRLHYVSAATTVGPALIVTAVLVDHGFDATGVKSLLVLALLLVGGPVITHAIGRAARLKDFGDVTVREQEKSGR